MNNQGIKGRAVLLAAGAFVAALYVCCFTGAEIYPLRSFALFCPVVFCLLAGVLKYLGLLKNRRALLFFVPVTIISAMNAVFSRGMFTYGNVAVMHVLFGAFLLSAAGADVFSLKGLWMIFLAILGNWRDFFESAEALISGARAGGKGAAGSDGAALADGAAVANSADGAAAANSADSAARRAGVFIKVLIGVLIAAPVLIIVTLLLISADMVFERLTSRFFSSMLRLDVIITFVAVWVYASGYPSRGGKIAARDWRLGNGWRADVVISATFLALLNLLFMLFAVVQCAYLFGGGFMTLPDGMVYSQYAREGFFQLLFVTLINFFVIIVFMCVLKGVRDSRLLRALLLALCLFTGVLIASSFYRMSLYIGVYGHTSMRLCVVTFLIMEVCLLCVTVTGLLRGNVPFIKCFLLIGLVFYMIVNVTGSDYFAARLNAGLLVSGRLRSLDLGHLGPDGLTAVKPLFESAGSSGSSEYICVLEKERKYVLVPRDSLSSSGAGFTFDEIAGIYRYPREKHWQNRTLLHVSNFQS